MNIYKKLLNKTIFFGLVLCFCLVSGCKKLIEIPNPKTEPTDEVVFSSDGTSKAAIDGLYAAMSSGSMWCNDETIIPALTADEIVFGPSFSSIGIVYSNNEINSSDRTMSAIWTECYRIIYHANSIIEGVANSKGMTQPVKNQLTGEAKFIRALNHFYLVNFYGDVPLITTTDVKSNAFAPRTESAAVYSQIIADLIEAKSLMAADFSASAGARTRANKYAASALLARVYLHVGNFAKAEEEAAQVISNQQYKLLSSADMNGINLKNNEEAIWQLDISADGNPTSPVAGLLLLFSQFGLVYYELRPELVNSFEPGDLRLQNWVGKINDGTDHYYPKKYQVNPFVVNPALNEYHSVLRLDEQYLIRAEARVRQNNLLGGLDDLNIIRNRAGLGNALLSTQSGLLSTIMHERQVELFFEHGLRWFDLKRTGTVDAVLGALKPTYKPFQKLYPIPIGELGRNFKLVQNPGY